MLHENARLKREKKRSISLMITYELGRGRKEKDFLLKVIPAGEYVNDLRSRKLSTKKITKQPRLEFTHNS